jgi:hypothetical protein
MLRLGGEFSFAPAALIPLEARLNPFSIAGRK